MWEVERILKLKEKKQNKSFFSKLIKKFKYFIQLKFNFFYEYKFYKKKRKTFSGWGMITTDSSPPWNSTNNIQNNHFLSVNENLIDLVTNKKFVLTQFEYENTDYKKILNELMWRHYVVFNSINYVVKFTNSKELYLVECGVCDGLTIFFAINSCLKNNVKPKAYLYDSWQELTSDKENLKYKYSYLNIERTKENLKIYESNLIYNKGFIPKIFNTSNNPEKVHWLHIDLNSTQATLDSLEYFYNRVIKNGIILFDDYGGFSETREIIDNFFSNKNGHFLNFPTGQGIFYKT